MSRPPRIPNWLPWEQETVYFLTFCVVGRKFVLANDLCWTMCLSVFQRLDRWMILSALAMPDHLHVLTAPTDRDASVSAFSKWFKRWFNDAYRTRNSNDSRAIWHWQEGCFDRLLRTDESASEKWNYIRQNPVRAGLVKDPDDWPYQVQLEAG
jgi:REP element-mobilizing transposase RayT